MRYRVISVVFALSVGLTPSRAEVSDSCAKVVDAIAQRTVNSLQAGKNETDPTKKQQLVTDTKARLRQALTNSTDLWICANALDAKFAGSLENRRVDIQVGATSGGSGSTSLVPSGSVPALLGLAVEYGGLTQAFSGTTVTFRTTPAKLIGAMANLYGPNATPPKENTLAALQRVSFSVSFDTSRTSSANTDAGSKLLANYQQLSQAGVRILLIHDRDPLAAKNWNQIRKFSLSEPAQQFADQVANLWGPVTQLPDFDSAVNTAMDVFDKLNKDSSDENVLKSAITHYFEELRKLTGTIPDWKQRLDAYGVARLALDDMHKQLYRKIAKAPSLTFEYDFTRPPVVSGTAAGATQASAVTAPDLSTASLVYVASLYESEYTLNATARFFNDTQSGMSGNFRDFQLAGKWDIPVGRVPSFIAKGTLTFSGLFEHLHQKPLGIDLLINDQKVNKPGNIGVFQAKYSIPVGDSGLQVPISFTASNRTELIQEKEIRGNIGITLDLDKLFAKSK